MSAAVPPGAARNDLMLYDGSKRLGTIRRSSGGVLGFDPAGKRVGAFPNVAAAKAALVERSREA